MAQFKKGDTVQLKSGGPIMTIRELESDGYYWCDWFSANELKGTRFTEEELMLYEKKR